MCCWQIVVSWSVIGGLLLFCGCASLPKNPPREEQHSLGQSLSGVLSQTSEQILDQFESGESAFMLLEDNARAMEWRLALIDNATISVDLQYFIWEDDESGRLLLNRLIEATQRGVRVRLLVDDFPIRSSDEDLAMLARRDNFNLRLFNPTRVRRGVIGPMMEMVVYFKELNRRMHNKLMIVDGEWAIIGGRNIGNHYFGLDKKYNFRDLDILMTGPIVFDLEEAYDDYWNSEPAYSGEMMGEPVSGIHRRKLERRQQKQLKKDHKKLAGSCYPVGVTDWSGYFMDLHDNMVPGEAVYLQDAPIVNGDRGKRLVSTAGYPGCNAESNAYIVTPYLIPPPKMFDAIQETVDRGANVTFLTASMAANNHTIAHSHYKKYRKKLLGTGANLYEFKHKPGQPLRAMSDVEPVKSKFISLHTKATVEDNQRVYLGSLNLDPRAIEINTENLIIIESRPLATQLVAVVEQMLESDNSWQVCTNRQGYLRWKAGDDMRYIQPARSFWQRLNDFFCRLLPVEGQL